MANPFDAIRKIKNCSWREIRTRGAQEIAARREQIGAGVKLPSDADFYRSFDRSAFGGAQPTAETAREKFYEAAEFGFFAAFRQKENTLAAFRRRFAAPIEASLLAKADKIVAGKFDLLGFRDLDFDAPVDWHFEPIANKRSPLKHWKQFDELDAAETGDKKIVWELNRHQHFFTLGAAFWLSGDEKYAAVFAAHLEDWMRQNPPGIGVNWLSSLEIAFRAMSWIWAFNFFKDSTALSPELFARALKFLTLHGRHIEKYLSTYYSPNTHLTGEALGLYYLGTQLPFLAQAARWRELGEEILIGEIERQITNDGVYFEQTTWYQRYTTDFYAHFLILRKLSGAENDREGARKLETRLQSALDFLMHLTRPDGTTPLVGDDDGGRMLPLSNGAAPNDFRASLAVGAVLFGRADYKFVSGDISEEIIWLFGAEGARAFDELPAETPAKSSVAFAEGGYFVMRDGWAATDNYLLVDCGAVGALSGAHGHADALAVNAALHGKTLFDDAGTYSYHESDETRAFFRSSPAHNVLTIDGESSSQSAGKFSWATRAEASLESWVAEDRFDFFAGAHDGYEKNPDVAATHERGILFLKNDYWMMRDFVRTDGEHDYAINFHCAENVSPALEAARNGGLCVGERGAETDSEWRLFTFGDNGGWRQAKSRTSRNYGSKTESALLQYASSGAGAQEFFTFLLPAEKGFAAPEVYEIDLAGGRAFVVEYRDYKDLFVFTDGERVVRTEFFDTDFKWTWARLSAGEAIPEELILIGGSQITFGGREVFARPQALEYAVARRFGSRLNVKSGENIFSVELGKS